MGPVHRVLDTSAKYESPEWIYVDGVGALRIKRPWLYNRIVPRYKNLRSARGKRKFWAVYKFEYPKRFEQYMMAGKWLSPEEGRRVYGA